MLWYLHLCADAGIVVTAYSDEATGRMVTSPDGGGRFVEVVLRPEVRVRSAERVEHAERLHERAHELCFVANSVNFPVRVQPRVASLDAVPSGTTAQDAPSRTV
jgi:organic hydroperoxide reductase OsmC/OhrA